MDARPDGTSQRDDDGLVRTLIEPWTGSMKTWGPRPDMTWGSDGYAQVRRRGPEDTVRGAQARWAQGPEVVEVRVEVMDIVLPSAHRPATHFPSMPQSSSTVQNGDGLIGVQLAR